MKATFYRCPECQKVFTREGQKHSITSDCDKTGKARVICPRVFRWYCGCGKIKHTMSRTFVPCWCECGSSIISLWFQVKGLRRKSWLAIRRQKRVSRFR